ncbi:branched-chain amino acid aminotransferase [Haloactinopolyspora alba]|uniref:Branched-chain-amino-acid aminotransferase n=1 Tax=Haloactinopolyspora alba TaxID=648780 RepID=A0A2P8E7E0_9ACTN|nr:branched-chain amino acid transaminase [Haloactinopolyspora alba]PSL05390.1 branched-chain amino acid aminotransferase [Haloactinopolyspora alba]
MLSEADVIWMDGALVPWADARVHVLTHGLHYGTGVLEGTRVYPTPDGPSVFRLDDHLDRLVTSARIVGFTVPYSAAQLRAATLELVAANGHDACYVRHLVYLGYGSMGIDTRSCPVNVSIASWEGAPHVGGRDEGARLMVSSWRRNDPNVVPPAAKATGPYLNSVLARAEANAAGYDEAVLLSSTGQVSECSTENVVVVRGGALTTPSPSAGVLEGITLDTVRRLAADLGLPFRHGDVVRSDLYAADEVFLCGTAAEIMPVRSVDDREIGAPGPITRKLRDALAEAVHGRDTRHRDWLTAVA